jgi:hypothetical protein
MIRRFLSIRNRQQSLKFEKGGINIRMGKEMGEELSTKAHINAKRTQQIMRVNVGLNKMLFV